jgi:Flp pilus assembly pilin Flp
MIFDLVAQSQDADLRANGDTPDGAPSTRSQTTRHSSSGRPGRHGPPPATNAGRPCRSVGDDLTSLAFEFARQLFLGLVRIALAAVQQSRLNEKLETKDMTTLHLRKSISTEVAMTKGYWKAVAVCVVALLLAMPPRGLLAAQLPLVLDLSFNIGPIAAQLNITNPVAQPGGGFKSTLHIHARDDTQTPAFNADLVATGQAADADTLLGGFVPASLIVKNDLLAGMTFQQAAADAQAKTGVTVTFLNDATMVEYALLLVAVLLLAAARIVTIQPGLREHLCAIRGNLEAGLAAGGFQNPPDPCATRATTR